MVEQASSNLDQIKEKVRRLTMSGDPSVLPDSEIERQINTFVEQDFPFDLRLNNFVERQVFYTEAGEDQYAIDMNKIRQPSGIALSSGREMEWMQDFNAFIRLWPKIFSKLDVQGDGSAGAYTETIGNIPILKREVVVSAILSTGDQEVLVDDGAGVLSSTTSTGTGTINYTTGAISFTFSNTIPSANTIKIEYVTQNRQRPYTAFFRNDTMILRPVPDNVYKIEYDAYVVPAAFLANNQNPSVNMFWQYIAFGASKKILEERQDLESLAAIMGPMREQESIIVNQTAAQNNQMRTSTIYYSNDIYPRGWMNGLQ